MVISKLYDPAFDEWKKKGSWCAGLFLFIHSTNTTKHLIVKWSTICAHSKAHTTDSYDMKVKTITGTHTHMHAPHTLAHATQKHTLIGIDKEGNIPPYSVPFYQLDKYAKLLSLVGLMFEYLRKPFNIRGFIDVWVFIKGYFVGITCI